MYTCVCILLNVQLEVVYMFHHMLEKKRKFSHVDKLTYGFLISAMITFLKKHVVPSSKALFHCVDDKTTTA